MRTGRRVRGASAVGLAVALVLCGASGCGGGEGKGTPSDPHGGSDRSASSLTSAQPGDSSAHSPGGDGDGEGGDDIPPVSAPPVATGGTGGGSVAGIGVYPSGDTGGTDGGTQTTSGGLSGGATTDPPPPCGDPGSAAVTCPPSLTPEVSESGPPTTDDGS
ncbi:hypothetical protein ACIG3E_27770 [Streptomyces sp. NPDC053474]|uniref:hypothetical protein n=1 Tax=Streptomyces sp. NPDC053474 TaxID=3365704 RepID=UPI0037CEFA19